MKYGRSLQELAAEIERQSKVKKDYLVETPTMSMMSVDGEPRFRFEGSDSLGITDLAHGQIGGYLDIPSKYYDRMRTESPDLLVENVNFWLHKQGAEPERRMVRTLDGNVRAFLSDRYRRIDNLEIAETVLPVIGQMDGAEVMSCEITETKMYIKVVNPKVETQVRVGDIVQSGIIISNSEVGRGSVSISPLIYRLVCSNGMVAQDGKLRRYHIGKINESDYDMGIFRDETIEADDRAFLLKVRDAVTAAADQTIFEKIVGKMREATEAKIEAITVPKVVEMTSSRFGITIPEGEGVLGHLIDGGDLSLYGLSNAVTRFAQDVKSYDRSTELETTGYKILTMDPVLWNSILSSARKEV